MSATSPTTAIGIFDSGVGGLTVLKAIHSLLPCENLVYLGDTARVPYGTKSRETVIRYATACAQRLRDYDIKYLVIACNTVSAVALPTLECVSPVPVLGVIEPGAKAGIAATRSGRIGVISTLATVQAEAYRLAISQIANDVRVFSGAAPLLVPLVEEGWVTGTVPELAVRHYIEPLLEHDIDTLILGCTHYPVLKPTIVHVLAQIGGAHVRVVDSAEAAALELQHCLQRNGLLAAGHGPGTVKLLVTDLPSHFGVVASRFLGEAVAQAKISLIDL